MIDSEGFRPNVGIVLTNQFGQLFWAKRIGANAWQFPQGGIKKDETAEMAMYRELNEEIGLQPHDVEIIGCTDDWLKYYLPKKFIRHNSFPLCIGQKQVWYLLKLIGEESSVNLKNSANPEFDSWRWVDYWYPVNHVVYFKKDVYTEALTQLKDLFNPFDNRPGI